MQVSQGTVCDPRGLTPACDCREERLDMTMCSTEPLHHFLLLFFWFFIVSLRSMIFCSLRVTRKVCRDLVVQGQAKHTRDTPQHSCWNGLLLSQEVQRFWQLQTATSSETRQNVFGGTFTTEIFISFSHPSSLKISFFSSSDHIHRANTVQDPEITPAVRNPLLE